MSEERILRWREVSAALGGVAKSTLYAMVGRGELPAPRRVSPKVSGWLASEITAYLQGLPVATREDPKTLKMRVAREKNRAGRRRTE